MSELKSRKFFEVVPTSKAGFYQPGAFADGYLKSEADKVIARNKYKRCLAMANFCFTKSLFLRYVLADRIQNGENYISASDWRINLYEKWCERWKKLAKKFKPNNSTAQ